MNQPILLVDDSALDAELTLTALGDVSSRVQVYHSGAEALADLHEDAGPPPKLILLDLNMPHMDGLAVLEALRAAPRTREIPVVILSSSDEERDIAASYEHGASAYVVKTPVLRSLREALAQVLRGWPGTLHLTPPA